MKYKIIDIDNWERGEYYRHFTKEVNCSCSVTAKVDTGSLITAAKQKRLSFYVALLYCVCKVVNSRDEFKTAYLWQEDKVVLWDEVVPSHIAFNKDTELITRVWSRWSKDFYEFYNACRQDIDNGIKRGGFSVPDIPPNIFDVSCIPWCDFTAVNLNVKDDYIYLAPIITWGKAIEDGSGKISVPMAMQIHHAVADGFHIARFFSEVEREAAALAENLL